VSVYVLSRRGRINFRYTLGWIVLCALGILGGALVPMVAPVARFLKITPAAFVSSGAVFIVLAICVQFSISISGMQEQIRRLTEDLAHLKLTVAENSKSEE